MRKKLHVYRIWQNAQMHKEKQRRIAKKSGIHVISLMYTANSLGIHVALLMYTTDENFYD